MLLLVEEVLLLALDDRDGSFVPLPVSALELAVSGAALLDLACIDRVDADLDHLMPLDAAAVGNAILDPLLTEIVACEHPRTTRAWLWDFANRPAIREAGLASLVQRGILRREDRKLLWVFGTRRYPTVDGHEQREVKNRILDIVLGGEFPDPRDVLIVCLLQASGLFPALLDASSLESAWPRIEQVARLDLMGKQVLDEIRSLRDGEYRAGWLGSGQDR